MQINWQTAYDFHEDKCYKAPGCKECSEKHFTDVPVWLREDGLCECVNCHQTAKPDEEQRKWFEERLGTKVEIETCIHCFEKASEVHYHKNPVTLKWETSWGQCKKCGTRFIV